MRKVALDSEPLARAMRQRQKDGIFDAEESLLDFEELLDGDDLKEVEKPVRDRANLMMFPTSWREAQVTREDLFVAHMID